MNSEEKKTEEGTFGEMIRLPLLGREKRGGKSKGSLCAQDRKRHGESRYNLAWGRRGGEIAKIVARGAFSR